MKIKILFENNWKVALSKCTWLDAYHLYFDDPDKVIQFCKKNDIQVIFGNNYRAQNFLRRHNNALRVAGLKFLVNSQNTLDTLVDKKLFDDFMRQHGFGSYLPTLFEKSDELRYPCIVKPKKGGIGKEVRIVYGLEDLGPLNYDKYICTELLVGAEYATSIFSHRGRIIHNASYKKTANQTYYVLQQLQKNELGIVPCATPFLELFQEIINTLTDSSDSCQCSINFKIVDAAPKIFEINCRIGYTLACHSDHFKEMLDCYLQVIQDLADVAQASTPSSSPPPPLVRAERNTNRDVPSTDATGALVLTIREMAEVTQGAWENLSDDLVIRDFQYIVKFVQKGDLFVVKHSLWRSNYVPNPLQIPLAIKRGAVALMLPKESTITSGLPVLRVENTYVALKEIAKASSAKSQAKRVLIVGSYGKTAAKLHLYQLLKSQYECYTRQNSANYAPSTYCNLASLKNNTEILLLELPATQRPKMISRAQIISPDICILTTIGHQDTGKYNGISNIIKIKTSVANALDNGGLFITSSEDPYSERVTDELQQYRHIQRMDCGNNQNANAQIVHSVYHDFGWSVLARIADKLVSYFLPFPEAHAPEASLPVLLAAYHLGANLHMAANHYFECTNFKSSGKLYAVSSNQKSFYLYDQTLRGGVEGYASFFRTLSHFKAPGGAKKIVLTSGFLDANDGAVRDIIDIDFFNQVIGDADVDMFYTVGNFCEHMNVLPDKNHWKNHAPDFESIKAEVLDCITDNGFLCVKSIFESNLDKFIEWIKQEADTFIEHTGSSIVNHHNAVLSGMIVCNDPQTTESLSVPAHAPPDATDRRPLTLLYRDGTAYCHFSLNIAEDSKPVLAILSIQPSHDDHFLQVCRTKVALFNL